ncbi:MAG: hypothetical protein GY928_16250 [Colwellia sp.]|nr:hypothetical protein [Colwellia sp.]
MGELKNFNKCVTKRKRKNGRYSINCKLGLWGVSADNKDAATIEALRYFLQYKGDGEYSSIIGGKGVIETLLENKR